MRTKTRLNILLTSTGAAAALLSIAACSNNSGSGNSGGDSVGDLGATDSMSGDGDGDGDGNDGDAGKLDLPGGSQAYDSIRIEPEDVVVEVVNGMIPADTDFNVFGVLPGGAEEPIDDYGAFTYSRPDLGTVNVQDGIWTPTGESGGIGTLRFEYEDGTIVETSAAVKLKYTYDPNATTPGIKDAFAQATTPDPAMAMLYPYDQTVFPLGLASPVIQWNGGAAGDIYKITAKSTYFEFETFTTVDPPSRYAFPDDTVLPDDIWVELTEATQGPAEIAVQRYDSAAQQAYQPNVRTWQISQANLTGILYYWEVNNGDVVRLTVGDAAPQQFIEKPTGAGTGCVACHSVSADGSTIVAGTYGGASPWATWEADGTNRYWSAEGIDPVNPPWTSSDASGFQAVSPTGDYVVTGQSKGGTSLKLSLSNDVAELATLMPPSGFPVHPTWSPDGQKIAFGVRSDGNWLDFNTSSLWVADVDTVTPGFSNYLEIVPSDPSRPTATFPTFTPDSQWVAYNKANQARTREAVTELYIAKADGTADVKLSNANGEGVIPAAEVTMNYEPTFMPVSVGGYYWLVFGSERSYGNTLDSGASTPQGIGYKQLWVTAIDATLDGSGDPSHPAFWLPGQETTNQNMRGYWALEPCRANGDSCESGFDCCTGFCVDDGMGNKTCSEDKPMCSAEGDACDTAADCCSSTAQCIGGFCAEIVPG